MQSRTRLVLDGVQDNADLKISVSSLLEARKKDQCTGSVLHMAILSIKHDYQFQHTHASNIRFQPCSPKR